MARSVQYANGTKNVLSYIYVCNEGDQFQTEYEKPAVVVHVP